VPRPLPITVRWREVFGSCEGILAPTDSADAIEGKDEVVQELADVVRPARRGVRKLLGTYGADRGSHGGDGLVEGWSGIVKVCG
jgi:hypothetical protein